MGKNLTQHEIIKMAAEAGAKAAIETFEKKKDAILVEQHDRRLHNTKLLLRNFRELAAHSDSAIYDAAQVLTEDAYDILDAMSMGKDSSLYIESIRKSVGRTRIIIEHVRKMLACYHVLCKRSPRPEDQRRYRVVELSFLDETYHTAQEIADTENVDISTVYRDINMACESLSALIFGVDGVLRPPCEKDAIDVQKSL